MFTRALSREEVTQAALCDWKVPEGRSQGWEPRPGARGACAAHRSLPATPGQRLGDHCEGHQWGPSLYPGDDSSCWEEQDVARVSARLAAPRARASVEPGGQRCQWFSPSGCGLRGWFLLLGEGPAGHGATQRRTHRCEGHRSQASAAGLQHPVCLPQG